MKYVLFNPFKGGGTFMKSLNFQLVEMALDFSAKVFRLLCVYNMAFPNS